MKWNYTQDDCSTCNPPKNLRGYNAPGQINQHHVSLAYGSNGLNTKITVNGDAMLPVVQALGNRADGWAEVELISWAEVIPNRVTLCGSGDDVHVMTVILRGTVIVETTRPEMIR